MIVFNCRALHALIVYYVSQSRIHVYVWTGPGNEINQPAGLKAVPVNISRSVLTGNRRLCAGRVPSLRVSLGYFALCTVPEETVRYSARRTCRVINAVIVDSLESPAG